MVIYSRWEKARDHRIDRYVEQSLGQKMATDPNFRSLCPLAPPKPTSERIKAHTPNDAETINIENSVVQSHPKPTHMCTKSSKLRSTSEVTTWQHRHRWTNKETLWNQKLRSTSEVTTWQHRHTWTNKETLWNQERRNASEDNDDDDGDDDDDDELCVLFVFITLPR